RPGERGSAPADRRQPRGGKRFLRCRPGRADPLHRRGAAVGEHAGPVEPTHRERSRAVPVRRRATRLQAAMRIALALLLLLAGCTSLLPGQGPLPDLYTLSPKNTFPEGLPRVGWQLVVEE